MYSSIEYFRIIPARNFVAGYPRNPTTYVAESDAGEYYEGFAHDYANADEFRADALRYFNRVSNKAGS